MEHAARISQGGIAFKGGRVKYSTFLKLNISKMAHSGSKNFFAGNKIRLISKV